MELGTNYRDTFVKYADVERVQKITPRNQGDQVLSNKKAIISGVTQTKSDFIFYPDHQPPKLAEVNQYISNVGTDLYPGNE